MKGRISGFKEGLAKRKGNSLEREIEYFINVSELKNLSSRTIGNKKQTLRYFQNFLSETNPDALKNVNLIKEEDIVNFVLDMKKRNSKPNSINIQVANLKTFFNVLGRGKRIASNPAKNIPKLKVDSEIKYIVTNKEYKAMLKTLDLGKFNHVVSYVAISILWFCGVRVGELVKLKMNDIDLENKFLVVRKSKSRKGRKIPIHPELVKTLESYLPIKREVSKCEYLLVSFNDKPFSSDTMRNKITTIAKDCGFHEITCHSFRRSLATRLLEQNTDLLVIKEILGHANLQMLIKYAKVSDSRMKTEIERL